MNKNISTERIFNAMLTNCRRELRTKREWASFQRIQVRLWDLAERHGHTEELLETWRIWQIENRVAS